MIDLTMPHSRHRAIPRPARPERQAVLRALTAPWWWQSTTPPFALTPAAATPKATTPAAQTLLASLRRVQRRTRVSWVLGYLVRGAWLWLIVAIVSNLSALLGGPSLSVDALRVAAIATFLPAVVLAALHRPHVHHVALMLDRTFGLDDRVSTALEHLGSPQNPHGPVPPLAYLQVAGAANVLGQVESRATVRVRLPDRELAAALVAALTCVTLLFMNSVGGSIPPVQDTSVPVFVPAADRFAAEAPASGEQAPISAEQQQALDDQLAAANASRQDLGQLATALDDHPVTRPAADAIQRGDYPTGSDRIRDAADNAENLSQETRDALADDLDTAADQMTGENPGLEQSTRDAAQDLRTGTPEEVQQSLGTLADSVDEAAEKVPDPSANSGQQSPAGQPQPGSSQSGNDDPSTNQGQSGDGSNDQAGQPSDSTDGVPTDSESSQAGGQSADDGASDSGTGSRANPGDQSGDSGQPGPAGQREIGGESAGASGTEGEATGDSAAGGTNAGSASEEGTSPTDATGNPAYTNPADSPPDPNVSTDPLPSGTGTAPGEDPQQEVNLETGDDKNMLELGGGSGSSIGSGAGVTVASGNVAQEQVGPAGPDSNTVPSNYRSIVERYFSAGDD